MPARCRPARENAAGDAQIPQRQTAVQRCREVMVDEQEGQKEEEEVKLYLRTSESERRWAQVESQTK